VYVDNDSTDNSLKVASKYPIKVLTEKRRGLSEARNCGIINSSGAILVFLDVDLKLDKDYLKYHEETFRNPNVGAGGGMVMPMIKTWVSDYLGVSLFEGYPRYLKTRKVQTYPGCNLTIRRAVLEESGYFLEKFENGSIEIPRSEDKEICQRVRKVGYLIQYNPQAKLLHKNRSEFGELFRVWIKGARSRNFLIKNNKKDPFSLLFKYNIPLIGLAFLLVSIFIAPFISNVLLISYIVAVFGLSAKSFIETGMFFESFLVKPWMDTLSLVTINTAMISYRYFQNEHE
jgi:glycosyltransferase involved in cell wall biosynthesis